jgi:hypothetical protein
MHWDWPWFRVPWTWPRLQHSPGSTSFPTSTVL